MRSEFAERPVYNLKPISKQLMVRTINGGHTEILPNIFEGVKAYCITHAKGGLKKYVPYTLGVLEYIYEEDYPDLFRWYELAPLMDEETLLSADFSKPFDEELAAKLRKLKKSAHIRAVDAEDIELGDDLHTDS